MKKIRVPAIEVPVHIAAVLKYSFSLIKFNIKGITPINIDKRNHHLEYRHFTLCFESAMYLIFKICLLGKSNDFFFLSCFYLNLYLTNHIIQI